MSKVQGVGKPVGVKAGSPTANVISPGGAGQIGAAQGAQRAMQPLVSGTAAAPVKMGNDLCTNVGTGGPGKGRTVHSAGSQGKH
jgi:hypothetical protein